MRIRTSYPTVSISLVLSLAILTVFTLRSFAAPETRQPSAPVLSQDCTGTLTVTAGHVTINGNEAKTGATVLTGSTIATNRNGRAIIDLGAPGRVELGESTSIVLTCVPGLLAIRSECGRTEIEVRRGVVDVKHPKEESLAAGKKETYERDFDATASVSVDIKIECEGRKAGLYLMAGLLALIAIGASVAVGIGVGNDEPPPTSPVK